MKLAVLMAFVAAAPAALAGGAADPGVAKDRIVIGSSGPLTGDAVSTAGVLRGAEAYFKYVNARGGVNGRKIAFKAVDDADEPALALENLRELVQVDQVFALVAFGGTIVDEEVRGLATTAKVPVVFAAARSRTLGRDFRRFPTTIGYLPPYGPEGALYARHVLRFNPKRAKIAVLYTLDDDGKDFVAGVRSGLGRNRSLLVGDAAYEPDVSDVEAQIADLKASGANTLMLFAPAEIAREAVAAAASLGWRPKLYAGGGASAAGVMRQMPQPSVQGAVSVVFAKDPGSTRWVTDAGAVLARQIVTRYAPGASVADSSVVAGLASAYSFVDALERAGENPTRTSLMAAVTHMNEASNPFLLPGIRVRTTPTSRFPVTQAGLARWQGGRWLVVGGLQTLRP